jgi:hypothetical protein
MFLLEKEGRVQLVSQDAAQDKLSIHDRQPGPLHLKENPDI